MQPPGPSFRALSMAAAVWGVVFAVVHFYWALGGAGGISDDEASLGASLYVGFIAVLGLLAAAVARGLVEPWGERIGRRLLLVLARCGGITLLIGVVVGITRWIADGSLGGDGPGGIAITAYFLLGGILLSALGWSRTHSRRGRVGGALSET